MIPKIIHYIWLGKHKKPKNFDMVFDSWKKYADGFEIKEWNEDNIHEFKLPSYFFFLMSRKKFAFASDILRFFILEKYGGVYMDVDQVLIKNIHVLFDHEIRSADFFIAKYHERDDYFGFGFLGMVPNYVFAVKMIGFYATYPEKNWNTAIIVNKIGSEYIMSLKEDNMHSQNMCILSQDYFYPLVGYCPYTENSYSYHLANTSWVPWWKKLLQKLPFYNAFKKIIKPLLPNSITY